MANRAASEPNQRGGRGKARFWLWVGLLVTGAVLWTAGSALGQAPGVGQPAPDVAGGPWLNSASLTIAALRGRVVLVEFWTYG